MNEENAIQIHKELKDISDLYFYHEVYALEGLSDAYFEAQMAKDFLEMIRQK